jgi:hypothetical protein
MDNKYTVADLEENGVEASGTFYGTPRNGWIMNMVDFVDYAGYAQLVMPVEGERWGFVIHPKSVHQLKAIEAGERFKFAGGQCLAEDVDLIYLGPADSEYSVACGYVSKRAPETVQPA